MLINTSRRMAQRGMGMLGFIIVIAVVAIFATFGFKLGPLYLDYWTLRTILHEIQANPQQVEGGGKGIIRSIEKRLNINSVYGHSRSDFKVKKQGDGTYRVTLEYEERVHLLYNIDAVASFFHEVDMKLE